jgi:hypothetical protein
LRIETWNAPRIAPVLCTLVVCSGTAAVLAQTSTGGSTSASIALTESDFAIYVQVRNSSQTWTALSTDDAKAYFNRPRCDCGTMVRLAVEAASTTATTKIANLLSASGVDGEARLYLGQSSGCTSDPTGSSYDCVLLDEVDTLSSLTRSGYWASSEIEVADLFSADRNCNQFKTTHVWKITDGNGDVAALPQGGQGAGGTLGWQATAGLALRLDDFDSGAVREPGDDTGVHHVYVFWDYSHIDASGLGMGHRLHVGDDAWSAGLLVES